MGRYFYSFLIFENSREVKENTSAATMHMATVSKIDSRQLTGVASAPRNKCGTSTASSIHTRNITTKKAIASRICTEELNDDRFIWFMVSLHPPHSRSCLRRDQKS